MIKKLLGNAKMLALAFITLFSIGTAVNQSIAQEYCIPTTCPDGWYCYCYSQYYGYFTAVNSWELDDNGNPLSTTNLSRTSGDEGCYVMASETGDFKKGKRYRVQATYYNYYTYTYNYTRLFIDWNGDGDFLDVVGGYSEYIGNAYYYNYSGGSVTVTANIYIPCDAKLGVTRMRWSTAAYYDQGSNACRNGYYYDYGTYGYNYNYGSTEDYNINLIAGLKYSFPGELAADYILKANETYDGNTRGGIEFKKPQVEFYGTQPSGSTMQFYIQGPLPSTNIVYRGIDPSTNSNDINVSGLTRYTMQKATGIFGLSDGSFKATSGGEYRLVINISGSCGGEIMKTFVVAWNNDISIKAINSPFTSAFPKLFKYQRNSPIKIEAKIQNTGINDVFDFDATATVRNSQGQVVQVFEKQFHAETPAQALKPTATTDMYFGDFKTNTIGTYCIDVEVDLTSAVDQEDYNDRVPRITTECYQFEVAYDYQLKAFDIHRPDQNDIVIGGRPLTPVAEFHNLGMEVASDVPVTMTINKVGTTDTIYNETVFVEIQSNNKYNKAIVDYFPPMILNETGQYNVCISIDYSEDADKSDNKYCEVINVIAGLKGTYTVGTAGTIPTIDSAMALLYQYGVTGDVVFELTDAVYNKYSKRGTSAPGLHSEYPAWDFRSRIIGLGITENGDTNTITWKPTRNMAATQGAVTINLYSENGKGIQFGQSMFPSNTQAISYSYPNEVKFANSGGFITFDGGNQKALRVKIIAENGVHAVPFYLGSGSQNITVKNILIENGNENTGCATTLPFVKYQPGVGFDYETDIKFLGTGDLSYSAGVALRASLPPKRVQDTARILVLFDTIPTSNNVIEGNDIKGFGYGILSLGYGPLFNQSINPNQFYGWYNSNNVYRNNYIHDICRGGIVLGYEANSLVKGNRINGVRGEGNEAVGIQAGGLARNATTFGYNVKNIVIDANEISNLGANVAAAIAIEQDRNEYPTGSAPARFPDIKETDSPIKISNNLIWGLSGSWRSGIIVTTDRKENANAWTQFTTPADPNYRLENVLIANNSIWIDNDGGIVNTGATAGIALQNVAKARVYNNAIAITDQTLAANSESALILYQGVMPETNNTLVSDYNAFWIPSGINANSYRFIETELNNSIVVMGAENDYETLDQWRQWTNQDMHSVFGNWIRDMQIANTNPPHLQLVSSPLGSLLENRGLRLAEVPNDFLGKVRGQAGQKYDIGAYEFMGRLYVSDMEGITISAPGAYRSTTGIFNDAEYIMTAPPVEVSAIFRNSGSVNQSGVDATVTISRMDPMGQWIPVLTETVKTAATSTDYANINFGLNNGLGQDFYPQTYSDLSNLNPKYVVPQQFASMEGNVTPLYKIEVKTSSDEFNGNNTVTKLVRFFLRRSAIGMIVSAENSNVMLDNGSTADQIAGKLNFDSLMNGLSKLGWANNYSTNRYEIDVLERNGWEPRAIDYTPYRSLLWSDADDKALTRQQQLDLRSYLADGANNDKKNLMISSQEMVRELKNDFSTNVLRSIYVAPGNPRGAGVSNDGNSVRGVAIAQGRIERIEATGYTGDPEPLTGLVKPNTVGEGVARTAYEYIDHPAAADDDMGVAVTTLGYNLADLNVDWRHYATIETVLRGLVDFIQKNGGTVIPAELANFNAHANGKSVELDWTTASELATAKFEVERADVSNGMTGVYTKVNEVKAAGYSSTNNYYSVVDGDVKLGATYSYRLRIVDVNGEFSFSDAKQVTLTNGSAITSIEVLPNPASVTATVRFTLEESAQSTVEVFDMAGRRVIATANESGASQVELNVSTLAAGSYTIVIRSGSSSVSAPLTIVR